MFDIPIVGICGIIILASVLMVIIVTLLPKEEEDDWVEDYLHRLEKDDEDSNM